jgi:prolyl-tRNA editing enzyme YbaK/EbsC (Cys-tRNA(Pro) deacylase)
MDPVQRVRQALLANGLEAELVRELPADTSTAESAASAVGAPQGSIVKSLIFLAEGEPLLVLVAGDQRADIKRLRAELNVSKRQLRIARPTEVLESTGFEVGGVPPVGHRKPVRTLIDRTLGRFEVVWAAAGSAHAVFPINYQQLVEITGGKVMDIVSRTIRRYTAASNLLLAPSGPRQSTRGANLAPRASGFGLCRFLSSVALGRDLGQFFQGFLYPGSFQFIVGQICPEVGVVCCQIKVAVTAVAEEDHFRFARFLARQGLILHSLDCMGRLWGYNETLSLGKAHSRLKTSVLMIRARFSLSLVQECTDAWRHAMVS